MPFRDRGPKWWQVYAVLPFMIGLFLLEMRLPFSPTLHQAAQIGILLMVYGYIHLWLRANASALRRMDVEKYRSSIRVVHFPALQSTDERGHSRLQLPGGEIRNVLGTTFELDINERDVSSVDYAGADAPQR